MKRFSIPPREERERHSHTMSAYGIILSGSRTFGKVATDTSGTGIRYGKSSIYALRSGIEENS